MINSNLPFFTIITTVKNGVNDIEETIKSVLSQTFTNFEYIIIDGGSIDGTVEKIMHLTLGNKNIKLYRQLDKGLYFALNKGLSYATGEVISILHAGDYFYNSTVLFKLYSYIKKNCNDSIFAIQAGGRFLYANNNYTDSFKKSNAYYLRYFYMPLNHPSLFISTDFYKKYGLFDTTFPIAADYELTLKLFKHNIPIFYINELFVTIAPLGLSGKKVNYNSIRELYQIKTKYFNIYFAFLTSLILYTYLIFKELFFKKRILKNNNESK